LDRAYALDAELLRIHRWSLTYGDLVYKLLARQLGAGALLLVRDVPSLTRAVNEELAALARQPAPLTAELIVRVREGAELSADEQRTANALNTFLKRHGHRSFSLDLAQPT